MSRSTRHFQTRLKSARLRHSQASVEDVDYRASRRLDKTLFQELATCRWIAEHRSLLVTGPCGVGKSWLSCALVQKACRDGYTVHYARVPRLFAVLELAHESRLDMNTDGDDRSDGRTACGGDLKFKLAMMPPEA
jgi:DNA replication protein DnaC